ncbi:MAG: cytochrome c [Saprospiraceae bacterium]
MPRHLFFIILFFSSIFFLANCKNSFSDGKYLYETHCQSCHMPDGVGLRGLIPPLADADYLKNNYDQLPCIILLGVEGEMIVNGKTYNQPMPAFPELATMDVALIINYINHQWGNDGKYTDFREVEANFQKCE